MTFCAGGSRGVMISSKACVFFLQLNEKAFTSSGVLPGDGGKLHISNREIWGLIKRSSWLGNHEKDAIQKLPNSHLGPRKIDPR